MVKLPRLAPPPPKEPPGKAALSTAADLIKWTTAFAVAELAFSIGLVSDKLVPGSWLRWVVIASWAALAVAIAAGALVYLRIPVKQAADDYDVSNDPWFIRPGQMHHVAFAAGTLALGLAMVLDAALPPFRAVPYRVRSATEAVAIAERAVAAQYQIAAYGPIALIAGAGEARSRPDVWRIQFTAHERAASSSAARRGIAIDVFVDALDATPTVRVAPP